MKLSEIKGDRALEVIADVMEPIANIANDAEAKKVFQNATNEPLFKVLPSVIKKHKKDVYSMLAILDGVTVAEYSKNASITKILKDFADVIMDESVQALFISANPENAEK